MTSDASPFRRSRHHGRSLLVRTTAVLAVFVSATLLAALVLVAVDRDAVQQVLPETPWSAPGPEDGALPDGEAVTAFEEEFPAVARLDADLLEALQRATGDAEADGVEITVTTGWRSAEYQERLLEDAIETYGSREEAARWVATPETSSHVSGEAVDVGPYDGIDWLVQHGAGYGLCQVYVNESWHFELRPEAIDSGCPVQFADASEDPRLQGEG